MGWPSVRGFVDGQDTVDAATLNLPLNQLAERTEHLYDLLSEQDRTKVAIDEADLSSNLYGTPTKGSVVYRVPPVSSANLSTYALARADTGDGEWFYADQKAMAVGIVGSDPNGTKATVVLYGLVDFGTSGVDAASMIVDEAPSSGRYYLSTTAGKLTKSPSGPVIYVGDCQIFTAKNGTYKVRSILVNPQYRDTGESHVHRSFVISGMPVGGYAVKISGTGTDNRFHAPGIVHTGYVRSATALPTGLTITPGGAWTYPGTDSIPYTLTFAKKAGTAGTAWNHYDLHWTSNDRDNTDDVTAAIGTYLTIGRYGLKVKLTANSATPSSALTTLSWTVTMPDAARAWIDYTYTEAGQSRNGYRLNLGAYPVLARFVPPAPENCSALTANGVDLKGVIFPLASREWTIAPADADGGPWLVWFGGEVIGDGTTATAPFIWTAGASSATLANATPKDIVFHANRMRVGPDGFVTSLQPAPGSPIRVTSAQTDSDATQGALQLVLDIDFTTAERNVSGHQVVKGIEGSQFKTGPVVERIVAGPGLSLSPSDGQGTVTLSASNAVYAGDFETIALRNAKQDLAGDVFPYTKLLSYTAGGTNVKSGFTAKFRVPDHIPYTKADGTLIDYEVVVSASLFGEVGTSGTGTSVGAFKLTSFVLEDQACSSSAVGTFAGSAATPTEGATAVIPVVFTKPYTAFDPVLIHGFSDIDDPASGTQRQKIGDLLLKQKNSSNPLLVRPGYFVGVKIERCAPTSGVAYTDALGILSLRWNLTAVS